MSGKIRGLSDMTYRMVCSECEYEFAIDNPMVGEVIVCGDCALNLRIVEIDNNELTVRGELTDTAHEDWGE
jgi:lysine biosynthesis protein LysW